LKNVTGDILVLLSVMIVAVCTGERKKGRAEGSQTVGAKRAMQKTLLRSDNRPNVFSSSALKTPMFAKPSAPLKRKADEIFAKQSEADRRQRVNESQLKARKENLAQLSQEKERSDKRKNEAFAELAASSSCLNAAVSQLTAEEEALDGARTAAEGLAQHHVLRKYLPSYSIVRPWSRSHPVSDARFRSLDPAPVRNYMEKSHAHVRQLDEELLRLQSLKSAVEGEEEILKGDIQGLLNDEKRLMEAHVTACARLEDIKSLLKRLENDNGSCPSCLLFWGIDGWRPYGTRGEMEEKLRRELIRLVRFSDAKLQQFEQRKKDMETSEELQKAARRDADVLNESSESARFALDRLREKLLMSKEQHTALEQASSSLELQRVSGIKELDHQLAQENAIAAKFEEHGVNTRDKDKELKEKITTLKEKVEKLCQDLHLLKQEYVVHEISSDLPGVLERSAPV